MKSAKGRIVLCWLAAILCAVLGLVGGSLLYQRALDAGQDSLLMVYLINAVQQVLMLAAPAIWLLLARQSRWQAFRQTLHPLRLESVARLLLLAVGGTVIISLIGALWAQWLQQATGYTSNASDLPDPHGALEWLLAVLAIAIVPALSEELLFRGLIQSALCRRLPRAGVWITAGLFAAAHLRWEAFPALLLIGLVLGWVYRRYGYGGSALLHAAYNAVVLRLSTAEMMLTLPMLAACSLACYFALRGLFKREESSHEADGAGL